MERQRELHEAARQIGSELYTAAFEACALLSKKALLRSLSESNSDERYAALEDKLLKKVNELNIGPQGLQGRTTALKVQVEQMPTHIAGMPCAVNICCHVCRHAKVVL